jgi:hypothetical protein
MKPRTAQEIEEHAQNAKANGLGIISNPFWLDEDEARHYAWIRAYLGQEVGRIPEQDFPETLFD